MSAYVVDREHVSYLVEAANSHKIGCRDGYNFSWYCKQSGNRISLNGNRVEAGQMLWNQNVKSVKYRYPDCKDNDLPGPIGEDFIYKPSDSTKWWMHNFDPIQVLKSCACYGYQSCEYPEWEESEAFAFIKSLKDHAISALPGYEKAKWGGPND